MNEQPASTPPCCDTWPLIRPHLKWFRFDDWPHVCAMPCVPHTDWRINFCPACGANVRSAIWDTNEPMGPSS